MQKQMILGATMLAGAVLLSAGCNKEETEASSTIPATPIAAATTPAVESDIVALPPPPQDTDVVLTVGDKTMTRGQLNEKVDEMIQMYRSQSGQDIPADQLAQAKQMMRRQAAAQFLEDTVIDAAIKKYNVTLDDAWKQEQIAEIEKVGGGVSYEEQLKKSPLGYEKSKELIEKRMLEMRLLQTQVFDKVSISDEAIKEAVEQNAAAVALVENEMGAALLQVDEGSAKFEDLVKADSAMKEPMTMPIDQLPPELIAAITPLKKGEISGLTKLPGALAIVQLVDRTEAPASSVEASHILVKVDKPEDDAAALAKITKIREDLIKNGVGTFAAVAAAESDCPSGKQANGSLGKFKHGQMVKEFEDAAFTQPVGEIGEIVKTQFGYHIILVTDRPEKETNVTLLALVKQLPEQQTAETIAKTLKATQEREAAMKFFTDMKNEVGVKSPMFPELQ